MRIAVVSMLTTYHLETGATRRTRRVGEQLAARGHEVTILCAQWWDGDIDAFERNGITYRAVTRVPAAGTFAARLPRALFGLSPDVVHASNHPPAAAAIACTAGTFLRTPVLVDWWRDHDDDGEFAYRRVARGADGVFAPSRMIETDVREHGAKDEAVDVVPESIDMSLVRETPADDRADIVYAREVDRHANVESFLLALAELRTRGWRAAVIGDGPARSDAESMARDLRIDHRVDFLGECSAEQRVAVCKGAHVFVQTADREPFATNLLRALACGCVGIVEYQAASSAHELVEGCPRGVRVTSPQEIADEIAAASDVAHATVNDDFEDYDHRAVLERYLDAYRASLGEYGLL
jgi:glycosyltransferase involved in cell wall biosynthesis